MMTNWKEAFEARRDFEARQPKGVGFQAKECEACSGEADNYHAYVEQGLCEDCRNAMLDKMRVTGDCDRCGSKLVRGRRFLSCPTCGLLAAINPDDRVAAVSHELAPRPHRSIVGAAGNKP